MRVIECHEYTECLVILIELGYHRSEKTLDKLFLPTLKVKVEIYDTAIYFLILE